MRAIDADKLCTDLMERWDTADKQKEELVKQVMADIVTPIVVSQPTIEPERKKGKWIQNDNGTYSCSLCQSWIPEEQYYYARFCLYCGADNS